MQINIFRTDFLEVVNNNKKIDDKIKNFNEELDLIGANNVMMLNDVNFMDTTNNKLLQKFSGVIEIDTF